jgi:hypothetical protein
MFLALKRILSMLNIPGLKFSITDERPSLGEQKDILRYLRGIT